MNAEGCVLNHTGDIDWDREHKKHASYQQRGKYEGRTRTAGVQ